MKSNVYQFIQYKVRSNLKAEAARHYLGFFWWIAEPLLLLGTFYFVFSVLLPFGRDNFASYLLVGISAWIYFANTVMHSINAMQSAAGLMQQVYVPKWVFPTIIILTDSIKFTFLLAIMFIFLLFDKSLAVVNVFHLLAVSISLFLFVSGVTWIVASVTPLLPDLSFIIGACIQLLMFTSGIFYQYSMIPESMWDLFMLNPLANLIYQMRLVVLQGLPPEWFQLSYVALLGGLLLLLGYLIMRRLDKYYPRVVG